MSSDRLSSENVHATTVAKNGRAVLISGPSGSGKSDLALRLFDRGFQLVSDDRTLLRKDGARLVASAPPTIEGRLEVRGIGIVDVDHLSEAVVALVVELSRDIDRLPEQGAQRTIRGVSVPVVAIDAQTASAAAKVELALDRRGLAL
ncbi:HPr kinase/phosphorylase [Sphingomonas jaspsi]|uniref:HPr kinase/phosphorylase n=1 Tax=Sphingomonas jaspsi TaxID=392409 RepID=UPI0004B13C33|nr:HPr kinase/phosphatase C-terminal domain-containing protein [Sphingomonas jaspsi]